MKYFILFFFTTKLLFSVELTPLYNTVDSKKSSRMVYQVKNTSDQPIAVNFSILEVLENSGTEEERIETNKVSFHPAQLVLKKGESKKVRVKYMKSTLPDIQEVYRVIAEELDVNVEDGIQLASKDKLLANIKMRYTYEGLLFINKPEALSKLEVTSFEEFSSNAKQRAFKLMIHNTGTASDVVSIQRYNYIITINNKEYTLQPTDMKGAKINRVLATKSNTITLYNIASLPHQGNINNVRLELKKY